MLRVSIAGGSGYSGGELLRLLTAHPGVEVAQVTSERFSGKAVSRCHPNLRRQTELRFCGLEGLQPCDLLFLCLPHGRGLSQWERFEDMAPRLIDLSADFRLNDSLDYRTFYGKNHPRPDLLAEFIYGIPELHRQTIRGASRVANAGCNATAALLALYPLFHADLVDPRQTVVEVKVGSSEGGNRSSEASHHPERSGCLRSFSPTGHRHTAEIEQELAFHGRPRIHFSATSVEMVRGVLATCHVFLKRDFSEKEVWRLYREYYGREPFVRIVVERDGLYRFPEPKILAGTNFCDIGFQRDARGNRLVVLSAIDNLMKGAAGQAVQNMNLMCGFDENAGLSFPGLHPV